MAVDEKQANDASSMHDCWNEIGVWSGKQDRCPELSRVIHCRNCEIYVDFGRQQLDRKAPDEYLQEWTSIISKEILKVKGKRQSVFIFRAGCEWLALPAGLIQEVVDMGIIHSIPHRGGKVLRGIVSIRGKLEMCFSIGALLGIERGDDVTIDSKYISPERLVVAQHKGQRIVFPVSQVFGIIRFTSGMLQQLPVTVSGSKAAFTKGIICLEENKIDVGLLEVDGLFKSLARSLL